MSSSSAVPGFTIGVGQVQLWRTWMIGVAKFEIKVQKLYVLIKMKTTNLQICLFQRQCKIEKIHST